MKKQLLNVLVIAALLTGCTAQKADQQATSKKGYHPEVPQLKSDVMTPELLWSFGRIGGVEVSPNGKTVLYGVTHFNIEEDRSYRDLYTVPTAGGTPTQITDTKEKEFAAVWRPDGKKIGYLSAKSGSVQLWEMNPDGTNKIQVSDIKGGLAGFKYAPTLDKVVYVQEVKLDQTVNDKHADLPKANARIENDIMYRHWDHWSDFKYNHLFIGNYTEGKLSQGIDIMKGEKYDAPMNPFGGTEQVNWSPDGKTLAYSCKKKNGKEYALSTNSEIFLYHTETKKTENFTKGNMGYDWNPTFSPDGKYLAWESMEREGYEADQLRLFVADLKKGTRTNYSKQWEQNVGHLSWSKDSKSIWFISDHHATDEIYNITLADGEIRKITEGVHNYQTIAEAGNLLVAQKVSMSQPAEIYSVDPKTGKAKALTNTNKPMMDQLTFGKVEKRWVKTTDNKDMLVWVIYPPHFDPKKKYPALLYCQGGPQGTVSQFWSYRWNFQMMAANDYIIVAPNRRGLPGFGMEWLEQISKDYGGQNIKDYLSAIDAVSKEPYVDEDKLGAVGASYGGFSVFYLAGNHNKRFKAFISHCGIFNFEQMYTTTEEMWFVNWDYGGAYWDKKNKAAQRSYKFSPHRFVDKWDTPLMVIHGGKDFRIPYTQGMGAYNAAILKGLPARFLYFPEENHWVLKAQNGILWQREYFAWLDKWLK
ncbi:S9 family peptidase [Prolixibacteraceae bacterium JC049]|nr:S9 family peptidase [Prolixibacteraceae bacterium JC049]